MTSRSSSNIEDSRNKEASIQQHLRMNQTNEKGTNGLARISHGELDARMSSSCQEIFGHVILASALPSAVSSEITIEPYMFVARLHLDLRVQFCEPRFELEPLKLFSGALLISNKPQGSAYFKVERLSKVGKIFGR